VDIEESESVVVGGGTAGAVVATRLSEDANRRVCLVVSAASAARVPADPNWNAAPFRDGAGFLDVGYDPETAIFAQRLEKVKVGRGYNSSPSTSCSCRDRFHNSGSL